MKPKTISLSISFLFSIVATFALSQNASAKTQTLDTKYGSVTIEAEPQRVVTLYEGALDASYAVDVKPLGAVVTRGGQTVASYLESKAQNISLVGTSQENNLEAILALKPDLILAAHTLPEQQYKLLSSIAPTVVPAFNTFEKDTWRKEAKLFAKALNKEEEMEQVLTELDDRTQDLKNQLQKQYGSKNNKAMLARWMPQGPIIMFKDLFAPGLLQDLGFDVSDGDFIKEGRPHSSPLSQEKLSLMDSDWLFMATLNEEGEEALAAAKKSKAFTRLKVVENDQVIPVDGQIWTSASGPLAAHEILNRVEATLLNAK